MSSARSIMTAMVSLVLIAALLSGCGGTQGEPPQTGTQSSSSQPQQQGEQAQPQESQPRELKKVTLRQPFLPIGYSVPFAAAKRLGYYEEAGFDVDIPAGKGSSTTIQTVASGSDEFGFADAGTAAVLISKDAPAKMLTVYVRETPMSICYRPSRLQLETPEDLRGRTINTFPGDAQFQLLPAVLNQYGMTMDDVNIEFFDPTALAQTYARNPDNAMLLFIMDLPTLRKVDPSTECRAYHEFGVNTYSIGLLTSLKMIEERPEEVRRFVEASNRGWEYTLQNPEEAVDMAAEEFPERGRDYLWDSWLITRELLVTPNTEGKPLGWMSEEDWEESLDVLEAYMGLEERKPLEEYYTNEFLPEDGFVPEG